MKSYIHVLNNPFFSVANKSDRLKIETRPAGTDTIEAVHEEFVSMTKGITVREEESKSF